MTSVDEKVEKGPVQPDKGPLEPDEKRGWGPPEPCPRCGSRGAHAEGCPYR
jgi:hypothetical protein